MFVCKYKPHILDNIITALQQEISDQEQIIQQLQKTLPTNELAKHPERKKLTKLKTKLTKQTNWKLNLSKHIELISHQQQYKQHLKQ